MFRNELTACLTLTAPVGMSEESRRDWLAIAWNTLKHIPPDILAIGAREARRKCDHPSKIVPTIIAETAERMAWRQPVRTERPLSLPRPDYVSAEAAARILDEFNLRNRTTG